MIREIQEQAWTSVSSQAREVPDAQVWDPHVGGQCQCPHDSVSSLVLEEAEDAQVWDPHANSYAYFQVH